MTLAVRAWFLLCVFGCSALSGCGGDDDDDLLGDDGSAGAGDVDGKVYELEGTWEFYSGAFAIRFEGTGARLLSFGGGFVTGRQHFDVGDEYIRNIQRIDNSTWKAEIARFDRVASPSDGSSYLHITGVTYVEGMLHQGLFLTIDVDNGIGTTRFSKGSRTEYEYGGACEGGFENVYGDMLYACTDADDSECNSLPGDAKKFWENTTCRQLGYSYEHDTAQFQYDEEHNGLPGAHGEWGDKRGGTGEGFADGSGGTPPADAVPVLHDMENSGTGGRGGEGGAGTSGGGASDCLKGTLETPSCGGAKSITLSFEGSTTSGRGAFTNPECMDRCDPIVFKYTYTATGSMLTLTYDKTADSVACIPLGIAAQTVMPPQDPDVMTFSCSGTTLTTETSLGKAMYTPVMPQ